MTKPVIITNDEEKLRESMSFAEPSIPDRISADPEVVENGLAKLVLSIIELIRRLLEKQALRRMDGGNLSEEEIERETGTLIAAWRDEEGIDRELWDQVVEKLKTTIEFFDPPEEDTVMKQLGLMTGD